MNADNIMNKPIDPDDAIASIENLLEATYKLVSMVVPTNPITDYVSDSFINYVKNYANTISTNATCKYAGKLAFITTDEEIDSLNNEVGNYVFPGSPASIYTRYSNTCDGNWEIGLSLRDIEVLCEAFPGEHHIDGNPTMDLTVLEMFEEYAEWRVHYEFDFPFTHNNIDKDEYLQNMKDFQDYLWRAEAEQFLVETGLEISMNSLDAYTYWRHGMKNLYNINIKAPYDSNFLKTIDVFTDSKTDKMFVIAGQIGNYYYYRRFYADMPDFDEGKVYFSFDNDEFYDVTKKWYEILAEVNSRSVPPEVKNSLFTQEFLEYIEDYYAPSYDTVESGEGIESDNEIIGVSNLSTAELIKKLFNYAVTIGKELTDPTYNPDTAASGEGIESDNETLPETANNTNITKLQNLFEQNLTQIIAQAEVALAQAQTVSSPLVLDTDGNGFETKAKTAGVYFDLDNNGFAEKTAWTNGDAFLTYDLNGNGKIDNGGELFGNHTLVGNEKAADGFAALSQYDENGDGFIDENDSVYQLMRLWNDNGNGISEDGEFKTLEEMGVNSIDLNQTAPETINYTDATVSGVSSAEMTDGTSRTVADFWFNVSTADTMQIYDGEFDEDILALPDVRSFGKMPSLRVAMQTDESGELKELVTDFMASRDFDERDVLLKQILYKMTGADAVSPTSRGSYINAQDLHVLETMLGAEYYGQGRYPGPNASGVLTNIFNDIAKTYSVILSSNLISNYLNLIDFTEENGKVEFDPSLFNLYIDLTRKAA
jgi:hypothetical protein